MSEQANEWIFFSDVFSMGRGGGNPFWRRLKLFVTSVISANRFSLRREKYLRSLTIFFNIFRTKYLNLYFETTLLFKIISTLSKKEKGGVEGERGKGRGTSKNKGLRLT